MPLSWNPTLKLVFSDIDDTVAEVYLPAEPAMIDQLNALLEEGLVIFFISAQDVQAICERVVNHFSPLARSRVLIGACSGAEVWDFTSEGELAEKPLYNAFTEALSTGQQIRFQEIIQQLITEYRFETYPPQRKDDLRARIGLNPRAILYTSRSSQVGFSLFNAVNLTPEQVKELGIKIEPTHGKYDLRTPVITRAQTLFEQAGLPMSATRAGTTSIDFVVKGVSKATAVRAVFEDPEILKKHGVDTAVLNPDQMEVWGDKYSRLHGGTDRHILEALSPEVRAIDFRDEDPTEFIEGQNITFWDGEKRLQEGLLEFLASR